MTSCLCSLLYAVVQVNVIKFVVQLQSIYTQKQVFASHYLNVSDVRRISTLNFAIQFSWLRHATPSGESLVCQSGLIWLNIILVKIFLHWPNPSAIFTQTKQKRHWYGSGSACGDGISCIASADEPS